MAEPVTRRDRKRARYSFNPHTRHRQRITITNPVLGFENIKLSPSVRELINLDARFFPFGIHPGSILEIKGPEKSGKTFLLTYLIARLLTFYPDKSVLFIDTRHKLDWKNLVQILAQTEPSLYNSLGGSRAKIRDELSKKPISEILESCPQFVPYFNRIKVIRCFSAEDLLLTFGPMNESIVEKSLLNDKSIALVAVDSIDNFAFSEFIQSKSISGGESPNLMECVKNSVCSTRCPVICTTLVPVEKHEYVRKKTPTCRTPVSDASTPGPSTSSKHLNPKKEMSSKGQLSANFPIDYSAFTKILELTPVSDNEKAKLVHRDVKRITHCVNAYLRSRQSANTAGSGGNHRVKFSIFSDMLWVV